MRGVSLWNPPEELEESSPVQSSCDTSWHGTTQCICIHLHVYELSARTHTRTQHEPDDGRPAPLLSASPCPQPLPPCVTLHNWKWTCQVLKYHFHGQIIILGQIINANIVCFQRSRRLQLGMDVHGAQGCLGYGTEQLLEGGSDPGEGVGPLLQSSPSAFGSLWWRTGTRALRGSMENIFRHSSVPVEGCAMSSQGSWEPSLRSTLTGSASLLW